VASPTAARRRVHARACRIARAARETADGGPRSFNGTAPVRLGSAEAAAEYYAALQAIETACAAARAELDDDTEFPPGPAADDAPRAVTDENVKAALTALADELDRLNMSKDVHADKARRLAGYIGTEYETAAGALHTMRTMGAPTDVRVVIQRALAPFDGA